MQVDAGRLTQHLEHAVRPVYLVWGDEPLQAGEAGDLIRARLRAQGFEERICLTADKGFDWQELSGCADHLSLFCRRRLLDLRLMGAGPGEAGAKALVTYLQAPPADLVLLVRADKLDARTRKSKWYRLIDEVGVVTRVHPPSLAQLPGWVRSRMKKSGLDPDETALQLLVDHVEGNLLAAAQEIEKLRLVLGPGPVMVQDIVANGRDSSHFDVFQLVDSVLAGKVQRSRRILSGLQDDGTEPTIVLWALVREIRTLGKMAFEHKRGKTLDQLIRDYRVWSSRKSLVYGALERNSLLKWQDLLAQAAAVDRTAKGLRAGNVWHELLQLSLAVASESPLFGSFSHQGVV